MKRRGKAASETPARASFQATAWIKNVSIYVVALAALGVAATKLQKPVRQLFPQSPTWLWVTVASLPLITAFCVFTIPGLLRKLRERRLARWGLISADPVPGYFRVGPYGSDADDQRRFKRADGAHETVRSWIRSTNERVLYLTGNSGSGKSSLLSAFVLPALAADDPRHLIIRVRAFTNASVTIRERLLTEGFIWERPAQFEGLDTVELFERALSRLGDVRLMLVLDQFEEVLGLQERDSQRFEAIGRLLTDLVRLPVSNLRVLLVLRSDYVGLLQRPEWRELLPAMQEAINWHEVPGFRERDARAFILLSGFDLGPMLMDAIFEQIRQIEATDGLVRPITLNLAGVAIDFAALSHRRDFGGQINRRGGLIAGYLRDQIEKPEFSGHAPQILRTLMDDDGHRVAARVYDISLRTGIDPAAARGCLIQLARSGLTRTIDEQQEYWEISHDFVARLIHSILLRSTHYIANWLNRGLFPAACAGWIAFFVALPLLYHEPVTPSYITAEIAVESREPGTTEPPTLTSAELTLRASRYPPVKSTKEWGDPTIGNKDGDLILTATGAKTIVVENGDQTEETFYKTTQFTQFVGELGLLNKLDAWKGAWIEAEALGNIDDSVWLDVNNDHQSRKEFRKQFQEFYGLTDKYAQGLDALPLGVPAVCFIYLNGGLIAKLEGQIVETGGGFHNGPIHYTIKFLPAAISTSPNSRTKDDSKKFLH